jgi:hypothetical protein
MVKPGYSERGINGRIRGLNGEKSLTFLNYSSLRTLPRPHNISELSGNWLFELKRSRCSSIPVVSTEPFVYSNEPYIVGFQG